MLRMARHSQLEMGPMERVACRQTTLDPATSFGQLEQAHLPTADTELEGCDEDLQHGNLQDERALGHYKTR
jgi:hypothetical protein